MARGQRGQQWDASPTGILLRCQQEGSRTGGVSPEFVRQEVGGSSALARVYFCCEVTEERSNDTCWEHRENEVRGLRCGDTLKSSSRVQFYPLVSQRMNREGLERVRVKGPWRMASVRTKQKDQRWFTCATGPLSNTICYMKLTFNAVFHQLFKMTNLVWLICCTNTFSTISFKL